MNAVVELSDDSEVELLQSQADPPPSSQPVSPASSYRNLTRDDDDSELEIVSATLSRRASTSGSFTLDLSSDAENDGPRHTAISGFATPSSRAASQSGTSSSSPRKRKRDSRGHEFFRYGDWMSSSDEELDSSPSKKPRSSSLELDEDLFAKYQVDVAPQKTSRRPRMTQEEKDAKKSQADADKAERKRIRDEDKRRKEADKAEEKRTKQLERAEKKAAAESLKADQKAFNAANVLQKDKKKLLHLMDVVLSSTLVERHPNLQRELSSRFLDKVGARDAMPTISTAPSLIGGRCTIRVKKTDSKRFDHVQRHWNVCETFTEYENTAILWLDVDEQFIFELQMLSQTVDDFRKAHKFQSVKDRVFILIYGLEGCKCLARRQTEIQDALSMLQMTKHVHLIFVEDVEEAAERLYDFTADLGIKPYKMIERSYLPFCSDVRLSSGINLNDTWRKMLHQGIHRVTESGAGGIVREQTTIRGLMEKYEEMHVQRQNGAMLLENCQVSTRKDGTQTKRSRLGPALSKRVHTVLFGEDPLELVDKER